MSDELEKALADVGDDATAAYQEAKRRAERGERPLQEHDWRNKVDDDSNLLPEHQAWLALSPEEKARRLAMLEQATAREITSH